MGGVGQKECAVNGEVLEGDVPGGLVGTAVTSVWMVVVSWALA